MGAINTASDTTSNFGDCLQARNMYTGVRVYAETPHTVTRTALCVCVCVRVCVPASRLRQVHCLFLSPSPDPRPRLILPPMQPVDNAGSFPGCIDSPRVNQTSRSHLQSRKEGADIDLHSPRVQGAVV